MNWIYSNEHKNSRLNFRIKSVKFYAIVSLFARFVRSNLDQKLSACVNQKKTTCFSRKRGIGQTTTERAFKRSTFDPFR